MVTQTVQVRRAGIVQDPCLVALPLAVTHGRSDITNQPDPPSAAVTWDDPVCPWAVGDNLEIWSGDPYEPAVYDDPTVTYDDPSAVYDSDSTGEVLRPRFVGIVAGLTATGMLGQVASWQIDAVGGLAGLGSRPVLLTRPQERDTTRATAIAAAAGVTLVVQGAPGVLLAAATIESDALSALHEVCASTGGLLWQRTDGRIVYGTAKHRPGGSKPVGAIDCTVFEDTPSWVEDVEAIVNHITVQWGPADATVESTHQDNESVAMPWGVRHADVTTGCASEADAEELALLVLARRAWPYYGVTNGMLHVDDMPPAWSRLFHDLDVSSPVLIPIPGTPGPTPAAPTPVVVEGWVETWDVAGHTAQAAFSDQRRWVLTTLRNWSELRDGGTWAHWKTGNWLDALVKGP